MKKAVDGAASDPQIFARDDAIVSLGVGKNMVRAIRFWGMAFKVLSSVPNPSRPRTFLAVPSGFGQAMFADSGLDPFCEDPMTYWLLHWRLLAAQSLAPVWWIAFYEFGAVEFSADDLSCFVDEIVGSVAEWDRPNPTSLKKDVLCLLRMYATSREVGRTSADDLVDAPFTELGLVRHGVGTGSYRFSVGAKPTLHADAVLFASLDFIARADRQSRTITLSRLATAHGAPGRAFKLTESSLEHLLEESVGRFEDLVALTSASGVPQLTCSDDPARVGSQILSRHYLSNDESEGLDPVMVCGLDSDKPATGALSLFEVPPVRADLHPHRRDSSEGLDAPKPEDRLEPLAWHQARLGERMLAGEST